MVEKITARVTVARMTTMRTGIALCLWACALVAGAQQGTPPPDRPPADRPPPDRDGRDGREKGPPFGKGGFGKDHRGGTPGGMFGWGSFNGGISGEMFEKLETWSQLALELFKNRGA